MVSTDFRDKDKNVMAGKSLRLQVSYFVCISHRFLQEYYPNIRNLGFVNNFADFAAEARITFVPNEVNATMVAGRY